MSITVTTNSNAINGDVATVAGLLASPGPDGISLPEAIDATNNDPGSYTIRFAPALRGKIVAVDRQLELTGGGVTLTGDIGGDGKPDVTLRPRSAAQKTSGVTIFSSGNRLRALDLVGFTIGVQVHLVDESTRRTLASTVIDGLVMREIRDDGILVGTAGQAGCGIPNPRPCAGFNRVKNLTITGNTIEAGHSGIQIGLANSVGDRVEGAAITDNRVRFGRGARPKTLVGIGLFEGGTGTRNRISDVLIARNSIEGINGDGGIIAIAGYHRGQANTIERVRILDNHVHIVRRGPDFCCQGITIQAGSERRELIFPNVKPVRYPDANVVRDVEVRGNSVSGHLVWGVQLAAGAFGAGGSRNRLEEVEVARNVTHSSKVGFGVYAVLGGGMPYKRRYATGNRITALTIDANRITIENREGNPAENPGGVVLEAGGPFSRDGLIRNARITRNRIATAQPGIRIVGGWSATSRGNRVVCVRLARNVIRRTSKPVSVTPNRLGASGNRVSLGGC